MRREEGRSVMIVGSVIAILKNLSIGFFLLLYVQNHPILSFVTDQLSIIHYAILIPYIQQEASKVGL